jgi:hypothetical protein
MVLVEFSAALSTGAVKRDSLTLKERMVKKAFRGWLKFLKN